MGVLFRKAGGPQRAASGANTSRSAFSAGWLARAGVVLALGLGVNPVQARPHRLGSALHVDDTRAEETAPVGPRSQTDGLSLTLGVGALYSGVGLHIARYRQVPSDPELRWAPTLSLGGWCVSAESCAPLGRVGLLGAYGHKHRLFAELTVGALRLDSLSLHGEPAHARRQWGAGGSAGYEFVSDGGFVLRTALGVDREMSAPNLTRYQRREELAFTLLGIGYKLQ